MTVEFRPLAVLYTRDLFPITVLKMTEFMHRHLLQNRGVRLAVQPELKNYWQYTNISEIKFLTVCIAAEICVYRGVECFMLFTDDEEVALQLRSELLPGQHSQSRKENQLAYQSGFAAGFFESMGDGQWQRIRNLRRQCIRRVK